MVTAANGAEALALCERGESDLVLLDVMMPDMDGFEVCRRLKTNPATQHIPVVMVTALDQAADRVARPRSRRRRFPDQAGVRRRADRARPLAGAAQDDDRRAAHARGHLEARSGSRTRRARPSPTPDAAPASSSSTIAGARGSAWPRRSRCEHTVDVETDPRKAVFQAAESPLRSRHRVARAREL